MNYTGVFDAKLPDSSLGSHSDGHARVDTVTSSHAPSDAIIVPDSHLLFSGDLKRAGLDLILSDTERQFVVRDYFKGEKHPALLSPDGASLSGDVVDAFTGHVNFAQAGTGAGAAGIIGTVVKLTGSATAIRNGVAVELNIGDKVYKGDVVQSGSDSALGISFIDGTAFSLSSNARMVLNDMIYDPNGSANSSLLSLVQGTISFVAGDTAKDGNMRVETPVATMGIRGTAVLVEISADNGPTKFSILVEPGGRSGSYTLTDKLTGLPIRTISQPGLVTFVSATGVNQPVSVVESLKTSTDLQNEREVVKLVFSIAFPQFNFDDASPKSTKFAMGSSVNNLAEIGRPLNETDGSAFDLTGVELRKGAGSKITGLDSHAAEMLFFLQQTAFSSNSSTLIEDSVSAQLALSATGTIILPNLGPGTNSVTIALKSSTSNAHLPGYTDNISQIGTFTVGEITTGANNTATVGWSFTLPDNNPVLQSLAMGQTLTQIYIITIKDNSGALVTQEVTVTLVGTNDLPTIVASSADTPTLTEDSIAANLNLAAAGTITFRDVDLIDTHTATVALKSSTSNAHLPGYVDNVSQIGTFALTSGPSGVSEIATDTNDAATVSWSFTLADNDPVLQSLALGETITQIYTVTIKDNNGALLTQDVKVTLVGTNDAPIITSEDLCGAVVEQLTPACKLTDSGIISFTDVDLTDVHLVSSVGTPIGCVLGTLTAVKDSDTTGTGSGGQLTWTYTVADSAIGYLTKDQTKVESFTITLTDQNGSVITRQIDITITGANDAASITGTATGAMTEDCTLTAAGTLTVSDVDAGENHFQTPLSLAATYGAFAFDPDTGVWCYALDNAAANVQALAACQVVHDTLTVKSADGTASQQIDVTITGSNDAASITGTATGAVTQDCMKAAGTLTVCDVDSGENHFQTPLSLAATYGEFAFDPNTGVWGYTLDNAAVNVQALAPCQVVHDTLTVKSADGTACQQIDVTITGSDQPPAAVGDTSVATPTSFAGAALLTVIETVDQDKLYNFDFAHDQIDLIGYAGFTGFADVQTHLIEDANGNAVITLADGQSVLLESVRAMALKESNFVFEDNLIPGAGRLGNGELTLKNAGTIDATDTHALTIDTGSNFVFNSGVLEASGSGGMTGASAIVNSGFLWANGGTLTVQGEVSGGGTATIDGRGTLDFESVSTADVVFGSGTGGTLKLGDSFHFNGTISGFNGSDIIHLADLASTTASISYVENAAGTGGTLSISNSAHTVGLALLGNYSVDNFSIAPDHAKGSLIGYVPHDLIA